jgi:hypothetical protein
MTIQAKFLCTLAASGFVALTLSAPAQALSNQECGAKYQAAKTAGTLNGQKYRDFQKAECSAAAAAAPAAPAAAPAPAPAPAPAAAEAKPKKEKKEKDAAAAPAAPVATGNAVFPTVVDPKYASEKPYLQRMHTCSAQWHVNKDNKTTGDMHWNPKGGGGFYPECNRRLKGEG